MKVLLALFVVALAVTSVAAQGEKDPYDFKCPACKAGVNYIQSMLVRGNSTDQIKAFIYNWCMKQFGRWAPNVCEAVDDKVDAIIADLKSGDLPQNVCNKVGLCYQLSAAVDVDWECPACKYGVRYAVSLLEQGKTVEEVEKLIHTECMSVFSTIAPYVCELIDNELANIVAYIESGDAPEAICKKIKLCKAVSMEKDPFDFVCPACKAVVYYVQGLIIEGNTTDEIKTFVHNFCMKQFGSWSPGVCVSIDGSIDDMIADLKSGDLPQNVCKQIGKCPAAAVDIDWECPACKYGVRYAVSLLEQGKTVEEVEKLIHTECMTVFSTIAPYVCELIDNELANIVAYIESGDAPETICKKIKLCKAEVVVEKDAFDFVCPACKAVVYYVQSMLVEGNTTEQIKTQVHNWCMKQFGRWLPDVCVSIDGSVDAMIADLKSGDLPQNVCNKIGKCVALDKSPIKKLTCSPCKHMISHLKNKAAAGISDSQLLNEAASYCNSVIPVVGKPICKSILSMGANKLASMIRSGGDNTKICKSLKAC